MAKQAFTFAKCESNLNASDTAKDTLNHPNVVASLTKQTEKKSQLTHDCKHKSTLVPSSGQQPNLPPASSATFTRYLATPCIRLKRETRLLGISWSASGIRSQMAAMDRS